MTPILLSKAETIDIPVGGNSQEIATYRAADAEIGVMADAIDRVRAALVARVARMIPEAAATRDIREISGALLDAGNDLAADVLSFTKAEGSDLVGVELDVMGRVTGTLGIGLDLTDPLVIEAARRNAAALVTGIGRQARESVRGAIVSGVRGELPRPAVERLIRGAVGMTGPQTAAYGRLLAGLESAQRFDEWSQIPGDQRRTLRQIRGFRLLDRRVVAPRPGISAAQAQRIADGYEQRAIRHRAETIARTETMRAANAGKMEGVRQQVRRGTMAAEKVWVAGVDDRVCPRCMPLHGRVIELDAPFEETGAGLPSTRPPEQVDHPPLHPRCRCTVTFRLVPIAPSAATPAPPPPPDIAPDPVPGPSRRPEPQQRASLSSQIGNVPRALRPVLDDATRMLDEVVAPPLPYSTGPTRILRGGKSSGKGGHFSPAAIPESVPRKPSRRKWASMSDAERTAHNARVAEFNAKYANGQGRSSEILLSQRAGDGPADQTLTFLHEWGHRIDYVEDAAEKSGFASRIERATYDIDRVHMEHVRRASASGTPATEAFANATLDDLIAAGLQPEHTKIADFVLTARRTQAYQDLAKVRDQAWVSYARNPLELWARGFSQYVAREAGTVEVQGAVAKLRTVQAGYQWSDEEFEALAPKVRAILDEWGLSR